MADETNVRSCVTSVATNAATSVGLLQFWDTIEITNTNASNACTVRFDGTAAAAIGTDGQMIVPASSAKVFGPGDGIQNPNGIAGATTDANLCHRVSLYGAGGNVAVEGHASAGI